MKKIIILVSLIACSMLFIVGCGTKEIENNEWDKKFTINGALDLTESKYYVNKDNIELQLCYNGDILRVGIVKQIRNSVEEELKGKYKKIDLTIKQEDPYDSANYIFENNKWDKEVK
ncbi:MAG: hypothetical protein ACLUG9_16580 [Paraclostridium sordellii]|uniref:hypothetical protein n=1 Tax=Paraclostridium sordellii TaxID=1505 RepID=UPI000E4C3792|nr:hypothetical protein [Paeniclostridium sordellii]RGX10551.1 hypothetical protein DWV40_06185 [Paeniclostridium sordellii]